MRFTFAMMMIALLAAACGGSEDNRVIPTEMVLETIAPTEENVGVEDAPTEEPTATEEEPEPTEAQTEEAVDDEETPEDEPNTAQQASLPFAVPTNSAGGIGNLPPFMQGGSGNWLVGEDGADAYACAETTCDVIASLDPDTILVVLEETDEWLTILVGPTEAFIQREFAVQEQAPSGLPFGSPGDSPQPPSGEGGQSAPPFGNAGGPPLPPSEGGPPIQLQSTPASAPPGVGD